MPLADYHDRLRRQRVNDAVETGVYNISKRPTQAEPPGASEDDWSVDFPGMDMRLPGGRRPRERREYLNSDLSPFGKEGNKDKDAYRDPAYRTGVSTVYTQAVAEARAKAASSATIDSSGDKSENEPCPFRTTGPDPVINISTSNERNYTDAEKEAAEALMVLSRGGRALSETPPSQGPSNTAADRRTAAPATFQSSGSIPLDAVMMLPTTENEGAGILITLSRAALEQALAASSITIGATVALQTTQATASPPQAPMSTPNPSSKQRTTNKEGENRANSQAAPRSRGKKRKANEQSISTADDDTEPQRPAKMGKHGAAPSFGAEAQHPEPKRGKKRSQEHQGNCNPFSNKKVKSSNNVLEVPDVELVGARRSKRNHATEPDGNDEEHASEDNTSPPPAKSSNTTGRQPNFTGEEHQWLLTYFDTAVNRRRVQNQDYTHLVTSFNEEFVGQMLPTSKAKNAKVIEREPRDATNLFNYITRHPQVNRAMQARVNDILSEEGDDTPAGEAAAETGLEVRTPKKSAGQASTNKTSSKVTAKDSSEEQLIAATANKETPQKAVPKLTFKTKNGQGASGKLAKEAPKV